MKKGFVLLYTVLISSIVLTIGLGAFSLVLGQIVLAGNVRDSAIAIYAAEAGIECARYWDYNYSADPATRAFDNDGVHNTIFCFGDTMGKSVGGSTAAESKSEFIYQLSNGAEVRVEVFKDELFNNSSSFPFLDDKTVFSAYGRNNTVAGPRTLERVLHHLQSNPY